MCSVLIIFIDFTLRTWQKTKADSLEGGDDSPLMEMDIGVLDTCSGDAKSPLVIELDRPDLQSTVQTPRRSSRRRKIGM